MREREAKKKAEEAEFDRLRAELGPKLKEWSEQYGKKKDIRALLVRARARAPRRAATRVARGVLPSSSPVPARAPTSVVRDGTGARARARSRDSPDRRGCTT